MRNITFILAFLLLFFGAFAQNGNNGNSQDDNEVVLPKSLRSGTTKALPINMLLDVDLGMSSWSYGYPKFTICPKVGIYPLQWLAIEAGPRYEMSYNTYTNKVNHAFGLSAFTEFRIAEYILINVGYDYLNVNHSYLDDTGLLLSERCNYNALVLGAGLSYYVTDKIRLYAKYLIYPWHTHEDFYYDMYVPMFYRIGMTVDF